MNRIRHSGIIRKKSVPKLVVFGEPKGKRWKKDYLDKLCARPSEALKCSDYNLLVRLPKRYRVGKLGTHNNKSAVK